jgi:hypothetical protein
MTANAALVVELSVQDINLVDSQPKRQYNKHIDSNKERRMGYKVLNTVDNMRDNYGPRKGLEGPYNFNGRVLYYDNKEGKYYDPRSDFYISHSEYFQIVGLLTA